MTRAPAWALVLGILALCGCAVSRPPATGQDGLFEERPGPLRTEVGLASWYGEFHHGQPTASGEGFDMSGLTAAHRTLPLGTRVRVVNVDNGRSVQVRINDRGPYVAGRILDLSREAARALDMVERGVAWVRLEMIGQP